MRLRALSEAECYARCYGTTDECVRIVRLDPPLPRFPALLSGESLRRLFEERLEDRERDELETEAA
jgi:hypothetical protein